MPADGGAPVQLTSDSAIADNPAWSPDGRRLAFTSSRTGQREIDVMDRSGGHRVRLVAETVADFELPRWSADGAWISFRSKRGDNYDLEVVRAGGGSPLRLTTGAGYDGSPSWSPDGARLAFVSDRGGFDALYVVATTGGLPTRLTAYQTLDPDWSR
jgi:Tol biopolymer transport system component